MSEHQQTLDMLARILDAVERTNEAVTRLAEAIAGARAKLEADKAIGKAQAVAVEPPKTEAPKAQPVKAPPPKAETPKAEAPAATYQDAANAVTRLAKAKGREAAVAVLQRFGATKLPDVPETRWGEVVAACEQALAAEEIV